MQKRNQELVNKYYARGIAASEKGEVELAIEDYTEAIALNPEFAEAYYQRGLAYSKKGEIERAIEDYTKAIAIGSRLFRCLLQSGRRVFTARRTGQSQSRSGDRQKFGE